MRHIALALGLIAVVAGPAVAFQCPLLIKQIEEATAGKTDANSTKARALAAEAKKLHEAGKHAESVAKADDAAKAIGLGLKKK
jgi:hypothetical protein